jgi:C1A family cysteine protease
MKRYHDVLGERRHLSGWKKARHDSRDLHLTASIFDKLKLPRSASLRSSTALVVEDQGDLGSCVANASTSAREFAEVKHGRPLIQLSRRYVYDEGRMLEGTPLLEDSGMVVRDAMKVLAKMGVPSEASYPYSTLLSSAAPPASLATEAAKHKIATYYKCPTLMTIKASISQGYPVVGGFEVPPGMMTEACALSGAVPLFGVGEAPEGGHSVLFVGYDDMVQRLCFMNSWGVGWGDLGFGYLPYSYVLQGLADDFWTVRL